MKDISEYFHISLPAATAMVNRIFRLGLIKRITDTKDRRVIKISLTLKGKKILNIVIKTKRKSIEDIFSQLSVKERGNYLKILHKIKDILYEKV